jgi:hypothetical protein
MQPKQRHAWTYVEGTLSGQDERSSGPDGLGFSYELREYTVDPDDLSAKTVAAKIRFIASGLPTTRQADRPVNTSAFLGTYLVRLPTTDFWTALRNRDHPPSQIGTITSG